MFQQKGKILALMTLSCLTGLSYFSLANAATTLNQNVTLTVSNIVTITPDNTQPMSFGTYTVTSDPVLAATLVMNVATGAKVATNSGGANFVAVTPQPNATSRGKFDISAAPNTTLTASATVVSNLTCALCVTSPPVITLVSVTPDDTTPTTDGTGAATVLVASSLSTVTSATQYESGVYTGTYTVTVNY